MVGGGSRKMIANSRNVSRIEVFLVNYGCIEFDRLIRARDQKSQHSLVLNMQNNVDVNNTHYCNFRLKWYCLMK